MTKEYIERGALIAFLDDNHNENDWMVNQYNADWICSWIDSQPTADVVEVVSGYHAGDICIYGFGAENKSIAIVEIVRVLNDERGVAEVKFHKVFVDDTGNGYFNYLLKSGNTMNASFKYLKNITPRVDGGKDNG